jgi:RimJ/RimL family protein N-acetyltransferase
MGEKYFGQRIYLRELTVADATPEYCHWLNDAEVNKFLETRKSTLEDLREYISRKISDPNCFFLGVFNKNNDEHIGNVKLELVDKKKKRFDFGILIGNKSYWGQGFGLEAIRLTIDYAFKQLQFNEIELGVIKDNERARRAFTTAGFRPFAVREKSIDHNGVLYDAIMMEIKNK